MELLDKMVLASEGKMAMPADGLGWLRMNDLASIATRIGKVIDPIYQL